MSTDARAEAYAEYCREKDAHDEAEAEREERENAQDRAAHTRATLERLQRGAGVIDSPQVLRALEAAWDAGRAHRSATRS